MAPTVDGETIPERPVDRILAGAAADIDLLVGSNAEETRLFFLSDGSIDRITNDGVERGKVRTLLRTMRALIGRA